MKKIFLILICIVFAIPLFSFIENRWKEHYGYDRYDYLSLRQRQPSGAADSLSVYTQVQVDSALLTVGGGTIDATPTNGSTNAVQSDGVYDALVGAVKNVYTQTSSSTTNTTASEISLNPSGAGSTTIAGNTLTAGSVIVIRGNGTIGVTGTPTLTFSVYVGGSSTTMPTIPTTGIIPGDYFDYEARYIIRTIGSSGTIAFVGWIVIDGIKYETPVSTAGTINTTTSLAFDARLQFSASSASNTITTTMSNMTVSKF